jgi:hypothetical protein
MKRLLFSGFLALIVCHVCAQKSPILFGIIPLEDLKMTVYPLDTSAAAVILTDFGKVYTSINSVDVSLIYERHVRIKILKKEGLHWANVLIPLFHTRTNGQSITQLKASTFNLENGRLVETEMEKSSVFKEHHSRNIDLQKFTLPNVKEGSIIEYTVTIASGFLVAFPNWQFQYSIPVRWSEYWAYLYESFVFEKYMQGYVPPTLYEVKTVNHANYVEFGHHWISKDVPAFKEEPFMTCEDDYVSKVNIALSHVSFRNEMPLEIMSSWERFNDRLVDHDEFGKVITGSGFLKTKAQQLTAGLTDPEQKIAAIFRYVQQSLEWNDINDKYPDNLKKVFEDKKGSSADINFVVAAMLEKVDIPVDMVLLSTRDHGFIRKIYPMERQLNYAVASVKLGDKILMLDATEKYLPMGILPERCLNGEGLVISKTRFGWIPIEPKVKARTSINSEFALNSTGELKGKMNFIFDGYAARELRCDYFKKGESVYLKAFFSDKLWMEIEKSEFQNISEIDKSLRQSHDVVLSEHVTVAGDVMYLNPMLSEQVKENVFKLENREYPVDFGKPFETRYVARFTLPENIVVDEIPKPRLLTLPNGAAKYTYNVTQVGNVLNVVSLLQVNKSLFDQTEYPDLRELYNLVVSKQAEQIVLKKK